MLQHFFFKQKHNIRIVGTPDFPWFVASDVAKALNYRDANKSTRLLDDDEKGTQKVGTPGGEQEMTVINEPGLYSLILRSNKPEAKQFKRWVTHEVLPSIRRTGKYQLDRLNTRRELAEMVLQAEKELQAARPKVEVYEQLYKSPSTHSMRKAAQLLGTGRNRLFHMLRQCGVFPENENTPYQKYIDRGYFEVKIRRYNGGEQVFTNATTFVTGKGLTWLSKLLFGQNIITNQ